MTEANRRKGGRAARALALGAAALALVAIASWLLGQRSGRVDVRYRGVTERDVEIARQMGYPDEVVAQMERGEWNLPSTREATRVAELAQDHVRDAYGIEAVPSPAWVPAFTHEGAVVRFAVSGGERDGAAFAVQVDRWDADPEFSDDLYAAWWEGEFDAACRAAVADALSALPEGSWLCEPKIGSTTVSFSGNLNLPLRDADSGGHGTVRIYISPEAVSTEDEANQIAGAIEDALHDVGITVTYEITIVSVAPPDGQMTVSFLDDLAERRASLDNGFGIISISGHALKGE